MTKDKTIHLHKQDILGTAIENIGTGKVVNYVGDKVGGNLQYNYRKPAINLLLSGGYSFRVEQAELRNEITVEVLRTIVRILQDRRFIRILPDTLTGNTLPHISITHGSNACVQNGGHPFILRIGVIMYRFNAIQNVQIRT